MTTTICHCSTHADFGLFLHCPNDPSHEMVCGEWEHLCRTCRPEAFAVTCSNCLRELAFCAC